MDELKAALVGIVFGASVIILYSNTRGQEWHDTLVDDDYAEYYLDKNHSKQWRMKPLPGAKD